MRRLTFNGWTITIVKAPDAPVPCDWEWNIHKPGQDEAVAIGYATSFIAARNVAEIAVVEEKRELEVGPRGPVQR